MNLPELLHSYGIPTAPTGHHHVSRGWIGFDCPWCSPSSGRFRMGWRAGAYCHCWTCGSKPLVDTLQELLRLPFRECLTFAKKLTAAVTDDYKPVGASGIVRMPQGRGNMSPIHRRYLRRRGFKPSELERLWELKGIGISMRLAWRILIPIRYQGEVVSWTTRAISDKAEVRYISARPEEEKVCHKTLLYGEHYCRHAVIVCEGPADVWRVGPGAVATFGTSYSREQVLRISKYPVRAIAYDNEPLAQRQAEQLCKDLSVFPGQTYRVELNAADPGEAGKREVEILRKRFLD